MRKINIFDTTLRDGEQSPGCAMTINEKVEIAQKLDEMKVDVIEAGFAASNNNDFNAIKEIGKVCRHSTVCSLARCNKGDIDKAYEALKYAKNKRIHVFIATSDIHMKYKLRKNEEEIKKIVKDMVSYAKTKFDDIEFSLEDATRTNPSFACEIINIAIDSGATTINIPDTVGIMSPEEFAEYIIYLKENSKINSVDISVHCHNDLGMATANTMAAIKAGAHQVECTINGIGERAGNTALEEIVCIMDTKKEYYQCYSKVDTTKIFNISKRICKITGSYVQNNKPIVGKNAFRHEAGIHQAGVLQNKTTYEIINPEKYGIKTQNIVLGVHSGKHAFINKMIELGFEPDSYNTDLIIEEIMSMLETNNNRYTDKEFMNIIKKYHR